MEEKRTSARRDAAKLACVKTFDQLRGRGVGKWLSRSRTPMHRAEASEAALLTEHLFIKAGPQRPPANAAALSNLICYTLRSCLRASRDDPAFVVELRVHARAP